MVMGRGKLFSAHNSIKKIQHNLEGKYFQQWTIKYQKKIIINICFHFNLFGLYTMYLGNFPLLADVNVNCQCNIDNLWHLFYACMEVCTMYLGIYFFALPAIVYVNCQFNIDNLWHLFYACMEVCRTFY